MSPILGQIGIVKQLPFFDGLFFRDQIPQKYWNTTLVVRGNFLAGPITVHLSIGSVD